MKKYIRFYKWKNVNKELFVTLLSGFVLGFLVSSRMLLPQILFMSLSDHQMEPVSGPVQDSTTHLHDEECPRLANSTVADDLFKKVRVLCWILTCPSNHEKKAKHVKATWGKRCNKLIFMSSKRDDLLPTVALNVREGYDNLWSKTKEAFKYIYKENFHDADWFLKADDDTYVILENLRYMLSAYHYSTPIYFGCRLKRFNKQGYMSGGAAYVLSKEALERFVEGAHNSSFCSQSISGLEDVEMGKCLEGVKVKAGDSRDSMGRGRFFPLHPKDHFIPVTNTSFWYYKYSYYKTKWGMNCCSDNAVSFHYVTPKDMYALEYYIYNLRRHGIT